MIGVLNPATPTVDIVVPPPRRIDLIAGAGTPEDQGWSVSRPTGTTVDPAYLDYDGAVSIRMADVSNQAQPSIARMVAPEMLDDLWNFGGRLYFRFSGNSNDLADCCVVGFGIPVSEGRGWSSSAVAGGHMGFYVVIRKYSGGFSFQAVGQTSSFTLNVSPTQSVDLEIRLNPKLSRIDWWVSGTSQTSSATWQAIDEFFTGVVGVYTKPVGSITAPFNIRRLMLAAYREDGTVTVPVGQVATRVVFPDEPRAWTIKVPDGGFLQNATIDVNSRGCTAVTFAPAGSKALFNGRATAVHSRPSNVSLRVTATQSGGDGGNWWVTG